MSSNNLGAGAAVAILLAALSPSAFAQTANTGDAAALRAQIEALRAEQARIAEMQRQTEAKIRQLEASAGVTSPPARLRLQRRLRWSRPPMARRS